MARRRGRLLAPIGLAVLSCLVVAAPAAGAHADPALIAALDDSGRYLEVEADATLDEAIDRANAEGIAFAWLDQPGDSRVAVSLADDYVEDLEELGSRYRTVVVLLGDGFGATSTAYDQGSLDPALDAAFDGFRAGAVGRGLDAFTDRLVEDGAGQAGSAGGADSGGGIGLGTIIVGIAVIAAVFLVVRAVGNRRQQKKRAATDMEEDRAEIREQLKNNADRVISLGDRVIASGDQELITTYEEASATYQDVSLNVAGASTPAEVDALDDRIDEAEWQLEFIEAKLDGRPIPPRPSDREADELEPAPPAPRAEPPVATSPRTGRSYPRTTGRRRPSGGLGGLAGGLGSILGSIVLGGGLGGPNRSRRAQRRTGGHGGIGAGGIGGSGGLGGGVLRRGGAGRRRSSRSGSRRPARRGGRSFGRSRSKGGRNL